MPFQALKLRPGINVNATPLLNEAGFSSCNLIRFFEGMLQKIGGWLRLTNKEILGTARALAFFEGSDLQEYIGIGSDKGLSVYNIGLITDITPISSTSNLSNAFSTTSGSPIVTITDSAGVALVGNVVQVLNNISVGGLILQGTYPITTIIDSSNYTITAASAATSSVTLGGSSASYTTTNASESIHVILDNHNLQSFSIYTVYISTAVGGITLFGQYFVDTIIDVNNFTFTASGVATSTATVFENSDEARILYEIDAGSNTSNESADYGTGAYGEELYGIGTVDVIIQARLWSLGAWGSDLVASYTNGPLYAWISENGLIGNSATLISQAPSNINAGIFIAMPQQQIVALGASVGDGDETDLMLVRWCDVGDYTDWTASATNQAGSFRLSRGSSIVGGLQGPQQGLIWTDTGLWVMQYIGFPLVYGFNELAEGCGLISQNAKGILGGIVYWMSQNGFFYYDGSAVHPLDCPVWDQLFQNIDFGESSKFFAAPNSYFNEISFYYVDPDNGEDGEISNYVKFNAKDNVWDYGSLIRTAWMDQTGIGAPVGVDAAGLLQVHEQAFDADGLPIDSFAETGWFKISDGTIYTFIERLIPDFVYQYSTNPTSTMANMQLTLTFSDYPNGPTQVVGPLIASQAVNYLIVRGRGRLVKIRIENAELFTFWRLGEILYSGAPAGRR